MRYLGTIVRLQVQQSSLKIGEWRQLVYDPAALRSVHTLRIDEGGARGLLGTNEPDPREVLDVHHADHPAGKNRGNTNALSLGFTGQYERMRRRFGSHLVDGIAGENILVQSDSLPLCADLRGGVLIRGESGDVHLVSVSVAEPCLEFSRWAIGLREPGRADERVLDALDFLRHGTRGFYLRSAGPRATVTLGAPVFAVDVP